jgi:hypothetical protein
MAELLEFEFPNGNAVRVCEDWPDRDTTTSYSYPDVCEGPVDVYLLAGGHTFSGANNLRRLAYEILAIVGPVPA